ncbi:plasmid replication protein [Azospirillum thermophilum]|uniref:Plasmid replication protein n=1 Tax=Azospirillum thermophilum TaxID=2202148 RepID=A0A2S2D053_9PROT|nr:plasmid replication protein [Azospirillum thermophilum]AWK90129.1 plasmid replication protein [Azospirillum thermophilum]
MSKVAPVSAAQLVLFELEDRSQSHLIALYDLAPRFVFVSRDNDAKDKGELVSKDSFIKSVRREFSFRGRNYRLTVQPARIDRNNPMRKEEKASGTQAAAEVVEVEIFPSEREQVVEQVVRRLAMDRSRLSLTGENRDKVQMRFSLYEIQRELRAVSHTLSIQDIRESLTILARSRIIISTGAPAEPGKKSRGQNILESTAFPVLAIRSRPDLMEEEGGVEETYLEFNPLVSAAIRDLEFKPISYAWLMKLKSPVSRWLYNRLSIEYDTADDARPMVISADEIIKNSGMNEWSRRRDTLRVVTAAVDALVEEGILDSAEKEFTKVGKRIDAIDYLLTPSAKFLEQVRRGHRVQKTNVEAIAAVTGSTGRPDGFVPLKPGEAADLRLRRARQLEAGEQPPLPLARQG